MYGHAFHGVVIVVGLVSCFAGFRVFKLLLTFFMLLAGGAGIGYLGFRLGNDPLAWSIGGAVLGAIVGGLLAHSFFNLAVGIAGAAGLAWFLLPMVQNQEVIVQVLIIGAAAAIAALAAVWITNLGIQLISGLLGGLLIVHGANFFITGQAMQTATRGEDGELNYFVYLDLDPLYAGIALALGLVGFLIQRTRMKKD